MIERHKNYTSDDKLHIVDNLVILTKYSRMIIYVSVGVMFVSFLILLILPSKYTATARLLPPQQNLTLSAQLLNNLGGGGTPGAPAPGGGVAAMAAGLLGLKSPNDLYVGMLTGNTIFDRIIERFNLRQLYKVKYIEAGRKALSKKADISAQRDGLITIEITDIDPKRAAEMANAFGEELDKLLQGLAMQEAKSRLAFLEKERQQTSRNLTEAENTLRGFSEQNSVIQIDSQTRGALEYIAQLRAEIDTKDVRIQVMRQQATPYNYDVVRLETELKGLRDKLANAEKQYDQVCASDVCLTTAKVPALALEYMRLYREVKFQDGLYQLYTKMVELARLDMVKDFALVQVVDQALPPEKRANKKFLIVGLAGIFTCIMMIFVAFGREHWKNAKSSEENSRRLRLIKDNLNWVARPFRRL